MSTEPLLHLEGVAVRFRRGERSVYAVRDVSLAVRPGDRIAIIGESGSGKTMTTLAMLGLLPAGAEVSGTLSVGGQRYDPLDKGAVDRIVRRRMAAVFQDSLSGLNPIKRIGTQLEEVLLLRGQDAATARAKAVEALRRVGITDPQMRARAYPHQLSGGMRQRVMIAMALLASPELLIADEPTTALDTLVQAQVIDLVLELQREIGLALLLITHDIALAADVCEDAVVMYAGYVLEQTSVAGLLERPAHPYSAALLGSMPRLDSPRDVPLQAITGEAPSAFETPQGCPFAPRCSYAREICSQALPPLRAVSGGALTRCVRIEEIRHELAVPQRLSA